MWICDHDGTCCKRSKGDFALCTRRLDHTNPPRHKNVALRIVDRTLFGQPLNPIVRIVSCVRTDEDCTSSQLDLRLGTPVAT